LEELLIRIEGLGKLGLGKKTGSKILNIDNKEQMKLNTTRIIE
jgi:hypothetical protein